MKLSQKRQLNNVVLSPRIHPQIFPVQMPPKEVIRMPHVQVQKLVKYDLVIRKLFLPVDNQLIQIRVGRLPLWKSACMVELVIPLVLWLMLVHIVGSPPVPVDPYAGTAIM